MVKEAYIEAGTYELLDSKEYRVQRTMWMKGTEEKMDYYEIKEKKQYVAQKRVYVITKEGIFWVFC